MLVVIVRLRDPEVYLSFVSLLKFSCKTLNLFLFAASPRGPFKFCRYPKALVPNLGAMEQFENGVLIILDFVCFLSYA